MPAAFRPDHVPARPLAGLAALLGLRLAAPEQAEAEPPGPASPASPMTPGRSGRATCTRRCQVPACTAPGSASPQPRAGAVAVLTDPSGRDSAIASGLPVFVVGDPRARLGEIAAWVYGSPSDRVLLIGVTGTAGKSTTSYLLESGLRAAGYQTGLIGGVETRIGDAVQASTLTTPEATDVQALLAAMAERRVTAAAMEVSSHALALGRVAGHALRRRDLHESVPGSPGLPRQHGRVLRGQGRAVYAEVRQGRRGQRR